MTDDIEKSLLRGEYALGVFLDITGAFDNLALRSAVAGMEKAGFPPNITSWYSNYLYNRQAVAEIKGCSKRIGLTKGDTTRGGP